MTNLSDEHYVLQLKSLSINDLQLLLTYSGQSRTGKRHELLERCYLLIKSSKLIRDKLDELYNKRFGQGDLPTIPYPQDLKNTVKTTHHHLPIHQQPANVDIHFLPLTFNEELCVISPPYPVPPVKHTTNESQNLLNFYFLLSAQQASDVATSTYFNADQSKLEFRKQILLRFTTIGDVTNNGKYALDKLPPNLYVFVNNKVVPLPQPKPTAKPNSDVIRPGRPIDITEYCRLCPLISNLVEISWFTQDSSTPLPPYIAAVYLTERKTVQQLLVRISRPIAIRPSIETQRTIAQTLSAQQTSQGIDDDLEVASTSLRLPLECPAMRVRMRMPGRATTCKHVHCFDLEGYLRMNEKKPTWLCPVCNKPALYTDLFIDQFFIDIICKCPLNVKAIEYEINGQWKPIEEEKLSRKAQREKETYKAENIYNGKSSIDMDHSIDNDLNDEQTRTGKFSFVYRDEEKIYPLFRACFLLESTEQEVSALIQDNIPIIELDDD
ncbi:unnamed protein product [Rotaria sp. Silwood1]|nr:unnamed protein product [Rotaria sp. Silwood1]